MLLRKPAPDTLNKQERANLQRGPREFKRAICTTRDRDQQQQPQDATTSKRPKPNLKGAGGFGNSKMIVAACILVGLYMYPMILKPMFGSGASIEEQVEKVKASGMDPAKTRPSNMPEWTSPFGPRSKEE